MLTLLLSLHSRLPRSELASEVHRTLARSGIAHAQTVSLEAITDKLPLIADRKSYGVKAKGSIWEVRVRPFRAPLRQNQ